MKIINEKGLLTIDLYELFNGMQADGLLRVADSIGCAEAVVEAVADQIIEGWTKGDSHASRGSTSAVPYTILDAAVRRIAKESGEIAKRQIGALESALAEKECALNQYQQWAWALSRLLDKHNVPHMDVHTYTKSRGTEARP